MSIPGTTGAAVAARGFQYKHGDRPLEGFTIQRAAGRGGFGEVYYALSDGGREVALKLIQTYEQIELRGISHCMNLKSPHLVTIFDVKYGLDGRPWVIMEFVSGPSLRELLDAAPSGLGISKAAFFLREIAKGLTYLHDCGIVHRDLKPGNIFYENGYVKIGDYGLSKAILAGQNSGQTITVGTVHYMAPEIGDGRYDKGIDIYALGALLYEMISGQVPFFGASPAEVLMKHLSASVDLSGIEEPFATVIRKAMAKNPTERYQSVQEMVEAVFGAEHVRNSVSHFSPESLSMVAAHVAQRLPSPGGSTFASSSVGAAAPPPLDRWGRLEQRVHRIVNRGVEAALTPCRRIGRRFERFMGDQPERPASPNPAAAINPLPIPPPVIPPPIPAPADPISAPQRRALAAVAIGLVAIGAGTARETRDVAAPTLFAMLAILGGTLGVLFGRRNIAPGIPAEHKLLRKLAVGGFAGLCAALVSLPVGLAAERHIPRLGETWLAMLACVFVLNWERRTRPERPARVDLGKVIVALVLGVIVGGIMGGAPALVAGIVAGIALAAQIGSPWIPSLAAAARNQRRAQVDQGEAAASPPSMPHAPIGAAITESADTVAAPNAPFHVNPQFRPASTAARVVWMILFMALATLGLCLPAMLIAGVADSREDVAGMLGFAALSLILSGFCLRRSRRTPFTGLWPYLFRPLLQIACIGSILISLLFLTVGQLPAGDAPPAIFFMVFPAVLFVVITFFARTGGDMSTISSNLPAAAPATQAQRDPQSEQFSLVHVAGGAGRFVLSALACLMLLGAFLLALAVIADLPSLLNSDLADVRLRNDFHRTFGNADGPRLLRALGSIGAVVLSVIALVLLLQVRRRAGAIHMLRVPAAVGLFVVALICLGHGLPAWSQFLPTRNGWELLDDYLRRVDTTAALWAAGAGAAGLFVLMWPAGPRRVRRPETIPAQEPAR